MEIQTIFTIPNGALSVEENSCQDKAQLFLYTTVYLQSVESHRSSTFWDTKLYKLLKVSRRFGVICRLHFQGLKNKRNEKLAESGQQALLCPSEGNTFLLIEFSLLPGTYL